MKSNDQLVDYLIQNDFIESGAVEKAFRSVDRADYVSTNPYVDRPQKIGEGVTISAPHIVAMMAELLEPEGKVLEMGSGSGYFLAILDQLTEEVVGVERIEKHVKASRKRLPDSRIILGDEAPNESFDTVVFSFAAPEEKIRETINKTGAERTVAPVETGEGQELKVFEDGSSTTEAKVRFVSFKEGLVRED